MRKCHDIFLERRSLFENDWGWQESDLDTGEGLPSVATKESSIPSMESTVSGQEVTHGWGGQSRPLEKGTGSDPEEPDPDEYTMP